MGKQFSALPHRLNLGFTLKSLDAILLVCHNFQCYLIAIRTDRNLTPSFSYSSAFLCNPKTPSSLFSATSALFEQKHPGGMPVSLPCRSGLRSRTAKGNRAFPEWNR